MAIGINPTVLEKTLADAKRIKNEIAIFFDESSVDVRDCEIYDIEVYRQIDGSYRITITLRYPGNFLGSGGERGKLLLQHLSDTVGVRCEFILNEHNIWK